MEFAKNAIEKLIPDEELGVSKDIISTKGGVGYSQKLLSPIPYSTLTGATTLPRVPMCFSMSPHVDYDKPSRHSPKSLYESPPSPCISQPASRINLACYENTLDKNASLQKNEQIHEKFSDDDVDEDPSVDVLVSKLLDESTKEEAADFTLSSESSRKLESMLLSLESHYQESHPEDVK